MSRPKPMFTWVFVASVMMHAIFILEAISTSNWLALAAALYSATWFYDAVTLENQI
jgi:hypothetical protein